MNTEAWDFLENGGYEVTKYHPKLPSLRASQETHTSQGRQRNRSFIHLYIFFQGIFWTPIMCQVLGKGTKHKEGTILGVLFVAQGDRPGHRPGHCASGELRKDAHPRSG